MTTRTPKTAGRPGFGGVGGGNTPTRGPRVAFAVSNYTQIPNAVIDEYMAGLSGAEFKVLAYIARRTFGFHRESARVSAGQLAGGLVGRDGRRLDAGTGLSRAQVFVAVKGLEEKGLVAVRRTGNTGGKSTEANTYTLWVRGAGDGDGDGEPVMGDEWRGAHETTPPRLEIGRGTLSGNQTPPRLETGRAYKGRKERGKYRPPTPVGNGKGKGKETQNQTQPLAAQTVPMCPMCEGCGVTSIGGHPIDGGNIHTLADVRTALGQPNGRGGWNVLCGCAVGRGWVELMGDEAKGNGPRKGKAAGATGGAKC